MSRHTEDGTSHEGLYYDSPDDKQIDYLNRQLEKFKAFARDIRDNYDCDSDAHKYGTPCRSCEAAKLIGAKVWNDDARKESP